MDKGAALVTGAGKRLGRAMALRLGEMGYDVAVHYAHSADAAQDVAARIRAMGRHAQAIQTDLLDMDQTEALVPKAVAAVGPLRVLINNASIFEFDTIRTATRDSWARHIGSNLQAPFLLVQAFAAQIPAAVTDETGEPRAQGVVINMLDQKLRKLTPEHMTYTIAKMGLWAFTQTAAQDLAPDIRINAIGPGPTLQGARQSAENFEAQRKTTLLRRGSNPQDITAAMEFILNSPALTGQLLCMDGGQHLAWQMTGN